MRLVSKYILLLIILVSVPAHSQDRSFVYQPDIFSSFGIGPTVFFDNSDIIDDYLQNRELRPIDKNHAFNLELSYKSNHLPAMLHNSLSNLALNFAMRLPFDRSSQGQSLNAYALFAEIHGYQYLDHFASLFGIFGFGASKTLLTINDDSHVESWDKINALLSLGGGADFRLPVHRSGKGIYSLRFSLLLRYTINMDILGINSAKWYCGQAENKEIPDNYYPGLTLTLLISFETLSDV